MFQVGQKVVCVAKGWNSRQKIAPPYGAVCTVTNVYTTGSGHLALEVAEYPAPAAPGYTAGWGAIGFRPAVQRKTDISFAHEILRKVNRKNKVRA